MERRTIAVKKEGVHHGVIKYERKRKRSITTAGLFCLTSNIFFPNIGWFFLLLTTFFVIEWHFQIFSRKNTFITFLSSIAVLLLITYYL